MSFYTNLNKHKDHKRKTKKTTGFTDKDKFSRGYVNAYDEILKSSAFTKKEKKFLIDQESKKAKKNDPFAKGYMAALGDYAKDQHKKGFNVFGERVTRKN